ncbi:uroporphyrinogen-III synthase [Curtobacterium sp. MCPF17_050]|uniref:uroporphyrinogen-III synthase n=1 Tax=Curtobacterium sp. MCPF17_050 TaxID=2175664 RepID=UPI000D8669A0|nr:uroporphyrinogen-III synthase [Curtobacterium sp. MCPF17_050]WIB15620.1 uroporphyrinogen-III synthase [Curtobacterium sp. MCPF17_050]
MVVVPRGGSWGERVAAAAAARGLDPRIVPLVTDAPPLDAGPLDRMVARLAAGRPAPAPERAGAAPSAGRPAPVPEFRNLEASDSDIVEPRRSAGGESSHLDGAGAERAGDDWLVVSSATTVRVLAERLPGLPAGVGVAAVGEPTARAARAVGWTVDLVPADHSAAGLVRALPADARLVLHPRSDLAAPTLVDGLRARGIDVSEVVAYRTVGTGDAPIPGDPAPDVVLVTSGSIAREVARRLTPLDPRTRIACIGPGTADEARAAGLPVDVVAAERSAEALLDAVVEALVPSTPEQEGHP